MRSNNYKYQNQFSINRFNYITYKFNKYCSTLTLVFNATVWFWFIFVDFVNMLPTRMLHTSNIKNKWILVHVSCTLVQRQARSLEFLILELKFGCTERCSSKRYTRRVGNIFDVILQTLLCLNKTTKILGNMVQNCNRCYRAYLYDFLISLRNTNY